MNTTLEKYFKIWDDQLGTRIELGPDREGLDLIELRQFDHNGEEIGVGILLNSQEASKIIIALKELIKED